MSDKYFGVEKARQLYNFTDKEMAKKRYVDNFLARTQSIFDYKNLPDTIPKRMLELYLQSIGHCVIAEHNGELYAFYGGLGGKPDVYYQPTLYTVANPGLNMSKAFEIDKDCVLMRNDSMYNSLMPLIDKYATMLMENDISMVMNVINTRTNNLISVQDDRTKASAELYLKNILDGKLGIVAEQPFLDGVKVQSTSNNQSLLHLIEFHQYMKASLYNDLGLNANFNMKREVLSAGETEMNQDVLYPYIDDMLWTREQAIDKVNKMFGTNIEVTLNSSWKSNEESEKLELEILKAEVNNNENESSDTDNVTDTTENDNTTLE